MKSARSLKGWIMSVVLAFSFLFLFASLAGAIDYTYDDLNRLLRVEYDDGTVIEYVYDEVGNRVQRVSGISLPARPTNLVASTVAADQPYRVGCVHQKRWLWLYKKSLTEFNVHDTHIMYIEYWGETHVKI